MDEDQTSGVKQEDKTPSESSTDTVVPATTPSESPEKAETTTKEVTEDATTAKPGSVEEPPKAEKSTAAYRIGELIRENKALRAELEGSGLETEETGADAPPPIPPAPPTLPSQVSMESPEYQRAKDFLVNLGFQPREEASKAVDAAVNERIEKMEARIVLDNEKTRLSNTYNGSDGRPKYDHDAVMKHAQRTGIYNPEAAYKDLHEPELIDWAIKEAQKSSKSSPYTERPTATSTTETGQLDRAALARILSTPEGRKWYEDNRDKVLSALQQGTL